MSSSVSNIPLDLRECLAGLKASYYSASKEGSDDDDEPFFDAETEECSHLVEEKLMGLLKKDDSLDPEEVLAKAKKCAHLSDPATTPINPKHQIPSVHSKHAFPCSDTFKKLPAHPTKWPQAPLMIRPTPHSKTKIRGIRRAGGGDYEAFTGFCAGCLLPINSGTEAMGESLVVDFESPLFVGTMLTRIKQAKHDYVGNTTKYVDDSYFDGKKRKIQTIVKGRFKKTLPMSECVTGQAFHRPAGKLPARWIVTTFIKFISTLAPQMEAQLDGDRPRFLAPLAATAHTVIQKPLPLPSSKTDEQEKDPDDTLLSDLEHGIEEPPSTDETSILLDAARVLDISICDTSKSKISSRMKTRKKTLNCMTAKKDTRLCFSTDREYTFEFYQHLLDFGDELAVDMGRPIGKVGLAQAMDGQPLKVMSAHKHPETGNLDTLWSFDIWHSSLYPFAEMAHTRGGDSEKGK